MGIFVSYDDKDLQKDIQQEQQKITDPSILLEAIGEYMVGDIDERFRTETAPDGTPWQPNSPFTINEKRRQGKILKILQRTGFMRSSAFYQINGNTLRVGLSDPKSVKHQLGIGVPKREIVGISKTQQLEISALIDNVF